MQRGKYRHPHFSDEKTEAQERIHSCKITYLQSRGEIEFYLRSGQMESKTCPPSSQAARSLYYS